MRLEIQHDQGTGRVHRGVRLVNDRTRCTVARLGLSIFNDHRGCRAYLTGVKLFQGLPGGAWLWAKLYERWHHASG